MLRRMILAMVVFAGILSRPGTAPALSGPTEGTLIEVYPGLGDERAGLRELGRRPQQSITSTQRGPLVIHGNESYGNVRGIIVENSSGGHTYDLAKDAGNTGNCWVANHYTTFGKIDC